MELRVRVGKELCCEYSGDESAVLVKIGSDDCQRETMWIGKSSLVAALKMIESMGGGAFPVQQQSVLVEAAPQALRPTAPVQKIVTNMESLREFERELLELIENPPKARDNEAEGLSELHIRTLVKSYAPAVGNKDALFNVLRKHIGMERERYDVMLEVIKNGRI